MYIDLQIHTVATPHHARWEPATLIDAAQHAGLVAIGITDHNTLGSVRLALNAGRKAGVRVIPGVEIDSAFGGKLWHTLVYGVAPEIPALQSLCDAVFSRNADDAERLQSILREQGFQLEGLDMLGRTPNVADVGVALGRGNELPGRQPQDDDEAAGMRYILTDVPGGYQPVDVREVIAVAHAAGGVAVLAHPGRDKGIYAIPATAADIAAMADAGLDGIEVFYPSHTVAQRDFYAALAHRHGLLVTGGSDSHGPEQPLARWPEDACAAFLARMQEW